METQNLGPNGALVFCMEMLEKNLNWLLNQMAAFPEAYFIFDLPGQVHHFKGIRIKTPEKIPSNAVEREPVLTSLQS